MAKVLDLQHAQPEEPAETKASTISIALCTRSHASYIACWAK